MLLIQNFLLIHPFSGQKLDVIDVTLNEDLQKSRLRAVLDTAGRLLNLHRRPHEIKWSVRGKLEILVTFSISLLLSRISEIHNKNIVQIIHFLVALIRHYRPPIKLPENVGVVRVVVQKRDGQLHHQRVTEQLTGSYYELGMRGEPRDEFDVLFDHSPDKLQIVKKSLVNFVNKHLSKINIECYAGHNGTELDPSQFSDGLLLIFLMGLVEWYFVPLGNIFLSTNESENNNNGEFGFRETAVSPKNYISTTPIQKLHNVNVAFQLLEDAGIYVRSKIRPEDIVNGDLKSVLRILYMIFLQYRHL